MSDKTTKSAINVLFISAKSSDMQEIKDHLLKSVRITYNVEHRQDFFGSSDLLSSENAHIDVILLDLGILGSNNSREVFRRMIDMAHGIPVVVFSTRKEHDMAMLAIEDGAADNITKGESGTDIFKFRDAISFSMARAQISRKIQQRNDDALAYAEINSAARLKASQKEDSSNLDAQKKQYADIVTTIIERGDNDIAQAVKEISESLSQAKLENEILISQLKKHGITYTAADE